MRVILEEWIFENFQKTFYDDVIYKSDSYFWSNEEIKFKAKDLKKKSLKKSAAEFRRENKQECLAPGAR